MSLPIIYEDEFLIAINKPAGMLVHPGRDPEPDDQVAMKALRNHLGHYVYILHRLDRPTSGVLLFAKTPEAQTAVAIIFEKRKIEKRYYAVVHGKTPESFSVDQQLRRSEEEALRDCLTHFKTLKYNPDKDLSLLEIEPITGRIHQIRRHLLHAGFPITGDYLYGVREQNEEFSAYSGNTRMLLMSYQLAFEHPFSGGQLHIEIPCEQEFLRHF
jgi:tRNA pseudouridine65 synthase